MGVDGEKRVKLFHDSMYYEIVHTFGVPIYLTKDALSDHTIGETINFSRQVHARLLADFLVRKRDKTARKGDAFAEDFGFKPEDHGFSADDCERLQKTDEINKRLVHMTYTRLDYVDRKAWSCDLLNGLLPVTIQFMQFIRDGKAQTDDWLLFANEQERQDWGKLLTCLERCQSGERLRFASGFNGPQTWYLPSTDEGSIAVLYGEVPRETPWNAAVSRSFTNTTSNVTVWPIDSLRVEVEHGRPDVRRLPPEG
jgi:hypothetical protein